MALKLVDPLVTTKQPPRQATQEPDREVLESARREIVAGIQQRRRAARKPATVPPAVAATASATDPDYEAKLKADFRLFVIVMWRFLLGVDPAPIMLDLAYWLQHGPDRAIILAFRGFAKSWITGLYALWRLYRDPQECVLIVSASLTRAVMTTNWCLQLIMLHPLLAHLKPLPNQRQSSKSFDVGPATPKQSPSFNAAGLGGQTAGLRANCIVPDDVETQQNSITLAMREKNREAVKEFDSILLKDGVIKYLGTPHDEDSLYNGLAKDAGYTMRIWPARFPTAEQTKRYGDKLAPYITSQLAKLGPDYVGRSTMPSRFPDSDLANRELSIGKSEFALQFMLDTSMSDRDKYPLKLRDLMVMDLDPRKGPESVAWSGDAGLRIKDLPAMGFEGDYYHTPIVASDVPYLPYTRKVGFIDNSGRGQDEAALSILGELNATIYWLHLSATKAGYEPETLAAFAAACVRYGVHKLRIESNFGDGMFTALFRPVLEAAWKKHNAAVDKRNRENRTGVGLEEHGGTEIEEVKASNQMAKEKRILSVLEPLTQQHRLVVAKSVIEWDYNSLAKMESTDTRHYYAWGHQYTHLTRERDCLRHDDRLDSLAGAAADFVDMLGVDPGTAAKESSTDRWEEELEKLLGDDAEWGLPAVDQRRPERAPALMPQSR